MYYAQHGRKAVKEFPVAQVTTHSPEQAYELVLQRAGCLPRDAVSRRIIREVRTGTGAWGRSGTEQVTQDLRFQPSPEDSDRDGMPDLWEEAHGLKPDCPDHQQLMNSGYTAIEAFCHERAAQRLSL
jgi:succinate dehydrogenase/fumarate reductase flavoprotein subunit